MANVTIDRYSVTDLRNTITKALNEALEKSGLVAQIGRITYEPGKELRTKLTVAQRQTKTVQNRRVPKAGESWMYGSKVYRIESVLGNVVMMSRASRARNARYDVVTGVMRATYRGKLESVLATGVFLKEVKNAS